MGCGGPWAGRGHTHLPGGSGDLKRSLQHLHEEGVDGRVPDELEEEEVFQALQAEGAQGWQPQQQLGEPAGGAGGAMPRRGQDAGEHAWPRGQGQ